MRIEPLGSIESKSAAESFMPDSKRRAPHCRLVLCSDRLVCFALTARKKKSEGKKQFWHSDGTLSNTFVSACDINGSG